MKIKTAALFAVCSFAFGCQGHDRKASTIEPNDLGITELEVRHDRVQDDQVLTVRGLDEDGVIVASAVLRTGMVMYGADTPEELHAGTELNLTIGDDASSFVSPDRVPHTIYDPLSPGEASFVGLHAVANEIVREAGIQFAPPKKATGNSGEVAYTAASCNGNRFPTIKPPPTSCCDDNYDEWQVNGTGQIAHRSTYVPSWPTVKTCVDSSGNTGCVGTGCTYGPCGMSMPSAKGTSGGHVFHPTSQPSVCGWDDAGPGGLLVDYNPEHYTSQTLYGGATPSCTCTGCNADGSPQCGFSDTFSRTTGLGSSWTVSGGGGFTTDGNYAVSTSEGSDNYATALPSPALGTADYQVTADITITGSSSVTGVIARYDGTNLYGASMSTDGYVTLRRQNDSTWNFLAQTPAVLNTGEQHQLRLVCTGSNPVRCQVWFDGHLKISYEDSSASRVTAVGAGGMHTQSSGVKYNDFQIDPVTTPVAAAPGLPFVEDFNRTGTTLTPMPAPPQSTTNLNNTPRWIESEGNISTDGTRATGNTATEGENWAKAVLNPGTNDYSVQADMQVPDSSSTAAIVARADDPQDINDTNYSVKLSTSGITLVRYDSWNPTTLGSYSTTISTATDYTVKLSVTGSNPVHLVAYLNGTQRISYDDSSGSRHLTGDVGIAAMAGPGVKWNEFRVDAATAPPPAWLVVQTAEAGSTSLAIESSGAGHLLAVAVEMGGGTSGTVSSITDNKGNTYVSAGARCISTSVGASMEIWYATNAAAGVTSITINDTGSVHAAVVWEVSGVHTTSPLQAASHGDNQSASSTPLGASITTSSSGEFIVSSVVVSGNITNIHNGNAFTNDRTTNGNGFAHLSSNNASAGTYQAQWDQDAVGAYCTSSAAFISP